MGAGHSLPVGLAPSPPQDDPPRGIISILLPMDLSPSSPWGCLQPPHKVISILPIRLAPSSSPRDYLHPPPHGVISILLPMGLSPSSLAEALVPHPRPQDIPQGLGLSPSDRWLWGAGSAGARLPAQHHGPDGDEAVGRDVPCPGCQRGFGVGAAGGRGGSWGGQRGPRVTPGPPGFPIRGVDAGFFGLLVGSVEAGLPPGAGGGRRGPRPLLLGGVLRGRGPPRGGRSQWPHLLCG